MFVAVFLSAAPSAAAAGDAAVDVRVDSVTCSRALVEETRRLTLVELNSSELPSGADAPRVFLTCGEPTILVRVSLGKQLGTRQLDLEQTDTGLRPRVLALAIAELVRDTASSEPPPPPPPRPRTQPVGKYAAPPAPVPKYSTNHLLLFAQSSNFGSHFDPLVGGGFGVSHVERGLAFNIAPALATSSRRTPLGTVRVLAGELSARISVRFPSYILASELGAGYGVGYARITAQSSTAEASANHVQGVWMGPFVFGAVESPVLSRLFLRLVAQAGYVTLPVRGRIAQSRDSEVAGLWSSLSLGVGWTL